MDVAAIAAAAHVEAFSHAEIVTTFVCWEEGYLGGLC